MDTFKKVLAALVLMAAQAALAQGTPPEMAEWDPNTRALFSRLAERCAHRDDEIEAEMIMGFDEDGYKQLYLEVRTEHGFECGRLLIRLEPEF